MTLTPSPGVSSFHCLTFLIFKLNFFYFLYFLRFLNLFLNKLNFLSEVTVYSMQSCRRSRQGSSSHAYLYVDLRRPVVDDVVLVAPLAQRQIDGSLRVPLAHHRRYEKVVAAEELIRAHVRFRRVHVPPEGSERQALEPRGFIRGFLAVILTLQSIY